MNHPDVYSSSSQRQDLRRSQRPASISELAERAKIQWDEAKGFKHYLKLTENYRCEGIKHASAGDIENAFVELAKAATLVFKKLPEHPDYNKKLNSTQQDNLSLDGQKILDHLAELKPVLVDRYEKWCQEHPDHIEEDTIVIPKARTHQLAKEDEGRAQQQLPMQMRRQDSTRVMTQHCHNYQLAEDLRGDTTTQAETPNARNWAKRELQMQRQDSTRAMTPRGRTYQLAKDQRRDTTRAVTPVNARIWAQQEMQMQRQDSSRAMTPRGRTYQLVKDQRQDTTPQAVTPNARNWAQRELHKQRQDIRAVTPNARTHQGVDGEAARAQLRMQQQMEERKEMEWLQGTIEWLQGTMENILKRDMEDRERDLQANDSGPGFEFLIYSSESAC